MSSLKTPFITLLLFFIGLYLYTTLAGPIPFSVNSTQTIKSDLFRVEGTGKVTGVPDTVRITVGVTKTAATVTESQKQMNATVNKLIDELTKLGIDKKQIKTTYYFVSPDYDFSNGKQTPRGFTATQRLEVQIKPIDKASNAIDMVTASGANMVGGISFVLDDETRKNIEQRARKEAIKNAKEKAQSLANAADIRLGRIIDVQEYPTFPPAPFEAQTSAVEKISDQTQLTPGEATIELTVTLTYETR